MAELRSLGVTKYKHEGTELELGDVPVMSLPKPEVSTRPGRSDALRAVLSKLDPQYADEALFAFDER